MTLAPAARAPAWRQVAARVLSQRDCGVGHLWLDLEVPLELDPPSPGQFVQILLPPTASSAFLPRPMSVASVRRSAGAQTLGFLYAAIGTGTCS